MAAKWTKECVACKFTWDALRVLGQSNEKPTVAGKVRMDELTYWHPNDDASKREFKADTIAVAMHNLFVLEYRAKRVTGVTKSTAVKTMRKALATAAGTMADLAEVNDELFDFWGEK
jgi:hypothetical protein